MHNWDALDSAPLKPKLLAKDHRHTDSLGSSILGGHIENPVDTWREAALTSPNSLVFTLRKEGRGERGREGSSRRRYDKGGKKRRGEG